MEIPRGDGFKTNDILKLLNVSINVFDVEPVYLAFPFYFLHAGSHALSETIMNKKIILGLIALSPTLTQAQEVFSNSSSEIASLSLDEVTVTAARVPVSTKTATGDVTVITHDEIDRLKGSSLPDLLRLQPGLQISTNGGMGTASNVFLRGTNAEQVVILVDGLRINSATLGTTAIENLPLALIDRIEILRGPASSLYGADAIGGVIQIFTRRGKTDQTRFFGSVGAGSYDTYTGSAGFGSRYRALQFGGQINSYDTRGISAKKHPPQAIDRDRDGYRNLSGSAYADLEFREGHSLGVNFMESDGRNDFDNAYNNYSTTNQQAYGATLKNQLTEHWNSTLKYGIGRERSFSLNSATSNSKFDSKQTQITWQHDYSLAVGTLTFAYDRLEQDVDTLSNGIPSISRTRNDDGFLVSFVGNRAAHSTQMSVREDHNSQYGNYVTGGFGYGYTFSPEWKVTAQYGSAFRAPTFNQLYFPSFGDPTLKPEKSDNFETSLRYQNTAIQAKMTVFENHIRDLIQNVGPATSGCSFTGFCPVNAGKVVIQGLTIEGGAMLDDEWQLAGNLTIQSPRSDDTNKLLPRRSQRYGNLQLLYKSGNWNASTELSASSARYNDAENNFRLGGYTLLNASLGYQLASHWKLLARANNLLNKDYVLATTKSSFSPNAPDYNTMGTNVFISLNYDMK
ncbi:TonB-dependent receptor domain-containing protein [Methylophilus glucosoxydans]|uniref:TonB-dependent receptor domain-containing protein n=1 Tax=Methylophilus glucosoxydans TaxID=752553 RepID=A0ABW3GKC7_9PROT|nr:TonB-dependent receptor [Methylophilus sp. VKM B-3414]MDT7848845.1 TonB-dependent receptor [Methylophilus sp. VKM B-3414]